VKNDKIIGAQYDRKNSEGVLLSLDQKENDKAKAKYGSSFRETSFLLTRGLVSAQKVEPNEIVKDSSSLDEFTKMVDYLIEKANSGEDGVYKL
jgi:major membrane immunogen (membrane-anchored lipoprotein)